MIVMKFGGTSVEDAPSIERVAEIIRARLDQKPVVVVSAMGKTTRRLLQAAEASAAGDERTTRALVADLRTRHVGEARRLVKVSTGRQVFALVDQHFGELTKLLDGLAILGEVPPRGLDKILAYGELLSSAVLTDALSGFGIPARLFDSRELIRTDDRYGSASPIVDDTNSRLRAALAPAVERGDVPVLQGFIGSSREGATTTLGFEGSDYTATIVGAALEVDDIQIWKDVAGLMTADPTIFPDAHTVKRCSFAEAADLTYYGAKVLHPKAIYPAARTNTRVHIYNSKRPEAAGTTITSEDVPCANPVKSIAYKRPVTVVDVSVGPSADGAGFESGQQLLRAWSEACIRWRIEPMMTSMSASHVAFVCEPRELRHEGRDLIEAMSAYGTAIVRPDQAIVSLVGAGLRHDPRLVGCVFDAINEIELGTIFHGPSPITMSFVVADADVVAVIARLHEVLFRRIDPLVFE